MPSACLVLSPIDSCVDPCTVLSLERPNLSLIDWLMFFESSGCASRATLSPAPVMLSFAFSSVDLDESGCWAAGRVSEAKREASEKTGTAYELLARLGVEVFAECVGHDGWAA